MPVTFAISGKGGVGKSTLAVVLIRWLNENGFSSVLAVDADANVNLCDLLGVQVHEAIGTIREEMREKVTNLPRGMTKQQFLEYKIHDGLVESKDFDLITMGRPEGPGCYCYANSLLRDILKTLSKNYEFVVIDNEAGMEHLSRRTTQDIDFLIIVSDPTVRGVKAAGRIGRLMKELETRVRKQYLVINRAQDGLSTEVKKQIEQEKLDLLAVLPEDETVRNCDSTGKPFYSFSKESAYYKAVDKTLSKLWP